MSGKDWCSAADGWCGSFISAPSDRFSLKFPSLAFHPHVDFHNVFFTALMTILFLFHVLLFTLQGLLLLSHHYHSNFVRKSSPSVKAFFGCKSTKWGAMSYTQEMWLTKALFMWAESSWTSEHPKCYRGSPQYSLPFIGALMKISTFQPCRIPITLIVSVEM